MLKLEFTQTLSDINKENDVNGIHHLFEQRAIDTPDNIAVIFKTTSLTYQELNKEANKLACFLNSTYKIKPDQPIGIMLGRSQKMLIGILAILKAGCAYLPIDPDGNAERNSFICKDAGLKIILCDKLITNNFTTGISFIDISEPRYYQGDGQNLSGDITGNNTAYIIYTSGTTGNPKGVLIKHDSLINFVNCFFKQFVVQTDDVFLQMSSFFFDASIMELFVPVSFGAKIVFLEPALHKYPEKISDAVAEFNVSMLFFTPAMLQVYLDYVASFDNEIGKLKTLKRIITGGDTLSPKLANLFNKVLFNQTGCVLTNIYGPTEATVWVTTWDCASDTELTHVPIGKPIDNTEIYIIDENNNIVETGQTGELVISGAPVAIGYLNRPGLNAEKFIPNPYRTGERMYKTGDKAKYLADGNIDFLGRMDNQVKLNGFRVELGEVESAILKSSDIKECVVLMKTIANVNELVAYFTATDNQVDGPVLVDKLLDGLNLHLPDYMIPAFYCKLDTFPVNSNGKIDKKNLPLDVQRYNRTKQQFVPSSSGTEKKLCKIFEKQLKIEKVSIADNLFELGVKSLMVTKIIIEIDRVLHTKISVSDYFQLPTIREMADFIDHKAVENQGPFTLLRAGEGTPLFLLPGLHGNPLNYAALVNNFPVYQPIYSMVIEEKDDPTINDAGYYNSFQDYAGYLVTKIKLIQPNGPYNLLGFSFGGFIAFEIVNLLKKSGNQIGLFIIISSMPPFYPNSLSAKYFVFRELDLVLNLKFSLITKYIQYRLVFLLGEIKLKLLKAVPNSLNKEKKDIKPPPVAPIYFYESTSKYHGDVIFIHENLSRSAFSDFAHDDYYLTRLQPKYWKNYITGKFKTHVINCMHLELLTDPYVKDVAHIISSYFDKKQVE